MGIKIKRNGEWVQIKTAQEIDPTLSIRGRAADAKIVGDKFDEIPIVVDENGYTDILNTRQPVAASFVKEGNTVTATTVLQGNVINESVITLNEKNYPVTIKSGDLKFDITWEGFEEEE